MALKTILISGLFQLQNVQDTFFSSVVTNETNQKQEKTEDSIQ